MKETLEGRTVSPEWCGWRFLPLDRRLRYDENRVQTAGLTLVAAPPERPLHQSPLHAGKRVIDALHYAEGPVACRVQLLGEVVEADFTEGIGIAAAPGLVWVAMEDASLSLHRFAIECAEDVLRRANLTDRYCWGALEVKRQWLRGQVDDAMIAAALTSIWGDADKAMESATFWNPIAGAIRLGAGTWDTVARGITGIVVAARHKGIAQTVARVIGWDAERRDELLNEQNAELERRLLGLLGGFDG